jgi:alkylated DNA repair dioxygenase AlkB
MEFTQQKFITNTDRTIKLSEKSSIRIIEDFLPTRLSRKIFRSLMGLDIYTRPEIKMFGKSYPIPRGQTAFGSGSYRYSNMTVVPHPWSELPFYDDILAAIAKISSQPISYVLVNQYLTGSDYVSYHSDDETDLAPDTAIFSYSVGASRRFLLRKVDDPTKITEIIIPHNCLVIMQGSCQQEFEHTVPKTTTVSKPRINMTFRTLKDKIN